MVKIIGIGNRLMADDGIALTVLEVIASKIEKSMPEAKVIFGETDYMYCLNEIDEDDLIIIIDATASGLLPGEVTCQTININQPKKRIVSQHQISLPDLLINYFNHLTVYVIGIEVKAVYLHFGVSPELEMKLDLICEKVLNGIKNIAEDFYA